MSLLVRVPHYPKFSTNRMQQQHLVSNISWKSFSLISFNIVSLCKVKIYLIDSTLITLILIYLIDFALTFVVNIIWLQERENNKKNRKGKSKNKLNPRQVHGEQSDSQHF